MWRAGNTHNSADGAGHVAVVEEIKANGDIVVSQSAYGGHEFYLSILTKMSGYTYSENRPLVGFVYYKIFTYIITFLSGWLLCNSNQSFCTMHKYTSVRLHKMYTSVRKQSVIY